MKKSRMLLITPPVDPGEFIHFMRRLSKGLGGVVLVPLPSPGSDRQLLSRRQIEVLHEMVLGRGTKEIAAKLGISPKTVESHRTALMRRLRISHLPGLVRYALRAGVLSPLWILGSP